MSVVEYTISLNVSSGGMRSASKLLSTLTSTVVGTSRRATGLKFVAATTADELLFLLAPFGFPMSVRAS